MQFATMAILLTILLAMLTGCLALGHTVSIAAPDARTDSYSLTEHVAHSATGCRYNYRVYEPENLITSTSIVIGHGFLRDQDNMVNLSRALANRGIRVSTLDFCNMHFWAGGHQQNAQDMKDLARNIMADGDVIYAGFSAGALAAVLAADDSTRAILALDLVDQNDLGLEAIAHLRTPLIGLAGPASSCNANNNGASLYSERADSAISILTLVPDASHCEFESPSDWLCELACGDKDDAKADKQNSDDIIQTAISSILPFLSKTTTPETTLRQSALYSPLFK